MDDVFSFFFSVFSFSFFAPNKTNFFSKSTNAISQDVGVSNMILQHVHNDKS